MLLLLINEHETLIKKPKKQMKTGSCSKPKSRSISNIISNLNNPTESRNTFSENPRKINKFFLAKLKGLGCQEASVSSSPASVKHARNKNLDRRKISSSNRRNPANVADVSYVCCTPPGVGIVSDFVPRRGNTTRSTDRRKYTHVGKRNVNDSDPRFPGSVIGSKLDKRSLRRIVEMMVFQENLLSARRIHNGSDRYKDWRLDIDDMSYEELLDLSNGIGNVCTGLKQEEISNCLRKFKPSSSQDKDWRCSVCQDKCRETEDIETLECGHHHHLQCIKQWLLQKNSCPVCKAAAI
ncbi:E3 ubiquitin-protein ligase MBR2-like [Primulina eburnea]|uniref:E3 ubiquitin-protein ligase MBR2-like n=1 Tax=Primulina eburnea TaxID=1245227 RepID=UPI003C6C7295